MPTLQVTPDALDLLQNVADTLAKSRKMVIITGAGISTNSGIPDFRSENGLYSLIQDQFERAEANVAANTKKESEDDCETTTPPPLEPPRSPRARSRSRRSAPAPSAVATATATSCDISERPIKRRRTTGPDNGTSSASRLPSPSPPGYYGQLTIQGPLSVEVGSESPLPRQDVTHERSAAAAAAAAAATTDSSRRVTRSQATSLRPTIPRHLTQHSIDSSTSHDSVFSDQPLSCGSSQTDTSGFGDGEQVNPGTWADADTPRRPASRITTTSSPLSSPPLDLFDPYDDVSSSTNDSSREDSDCSDTSESDDTQQSLDFFSSQASSSNLRNMKGKDLFDCNIWADPLKTSVFYRFATSLRQRVKEVEPTITHRFIAQMRDVGKLARVYTQNIDEIEKKIGLSTDLKHGFGSKKRKSMKPQVSELLDKEDATQSSDEVRAASAANADQGLPISESLTLTQSKPRPTLGPDKGVECVFLHGSLHSLRCFVCGKLCDWDEDGRESCTLSGEQPECPHCAGATAARQEKGKRALGIGKLRPDIVLYGEEHPQSDLISPIVQHDLAAGPDLLLVLGTSLRVHGLKVMVKEFAKAVHKKGGKVVFINFTKPSESAWGDVLDYWIEWDCDAWVQDLRTRKPLLWLSPNERREMERQRRETVAEKKKEGLKKRESFDGKKRDSLGGRRLPLPEHSKTRPPPKNPVAMRNDYQCGAYVVWEIFQALAKISDRPFNNLGYIPPVSVLASGTPSDSVSKSTTGCRGDPGVPPKRRPGSQKKARKPLPTRASKQEHCPHYQPTPDDSSSIPGRFANPDHLAPGALIGAAFSNSKAQQQSVTSSNVDKPIAKKKKARKSAPVNLGTNIDVNHEKKPINTKKRHDRHTTTGQFFQAARELARSGKTPTPGVSAIPHTLPTIPGYPAPAFEPNNPDQRPILEPNHFIGRSHVDDGRSHSTSSFLFQPRMLPPLPTPPGLQYSPPVSAAGSGCTQGLALAPLNNEWKDTWKESSPSTLAPMEINPLVGPGSPLAENRPGFGKPHFFYTWYHSTQPIYNDPLVGISRQVSVHKPQWHVESIDDNTPSPSDQLRMEAATQLSQLRGAT
ncbi:DHS-like NAD/FAD-binding domain-containing protein [Xylaria sp. FL0064]|nr:DHS-like NAD/FAD-binding domain-containing protein [Xylaria sp. FL0064]